MSASDRIYQERADRRRWERTGDPQCAPDAPDGHSEFPELESDDRELDRRREEDPRPFGQQVEEDVPRHVRVRDDGTVMA